MSSHFDEKSGVVSCKTPWGSWYQTVEEIVVNVNVEEGTRGRDIRVNIKPNHITCTVKGEILFAETLFRGVVVDESTWSVEDKKFLRIFLIKSSKKKEDACWSSLFEGGEYTVDPFTKDQMQKKLTLERFQIENPGFDFSSADISGNYEDGGPYLDFSKKH